MGGAGGTLDRVCALATAGNTIKVMTAAAETIILFMAGDNPYTVRANNPVTLTSLGWSTDDQRVMHIPVCSVNRPNARDYLTPSASIIQGAGSGKWSLINLLDFIPVTGRAVASPAGVCIGACRSGIAVVFR
jgi:hypothetical protein